MWRRSRRWEILIVPNGNAKHILPSQDTKLQIFKWMQMIKNHKIKVFLLMCVQFSPVSRHRHQQHATHICTFMLIFLWFFLLFNLIKKINPYLNATLHQFLPALSKSTTESGYISILTIIFAGNQDDCSIFSSSIRSFRTSLIFVYGWLQLRNLPAFKLLFYYAFNWNLIAAYKFELI